jgi:hypothetical protein
MLQRKLTAFQMRKFLGMSSRFDLWKLLKERQIETYTVEDLENDLAVLDAR